MHALNIIAGQEWKIHKNLNKNFIFSQYGAVFEHFNTVTAIVGRSIPKCVCVCAIADVRQSFGLGSAG